MNIVVTVGVQIASIPALERLFRMGIVDFRLPLAKQLPNGHLETARQIARLGEIHGHKASVIMDLPGSKPRLTNRTQQYIESGELVEFSLVAERTDGERADIKCFGIAGFGDHRPGVGKLIVSGDGELAFAIEDAGTQWFRARALRGGRLGPCRGLTIQGEHSNFTTLTKQDQQSLALLADGAFTSVMLSFVESADTIHSVRRMIGAIVGRDRPPLEIIAKIETLTGVRRIAEICTAADRILLGRGDLLLSVGPIEFFSAEEAVIRAVTAAGKPLIVGTQLLNSMSDDWLPNRSELSHLSRLIANGVDGFLLSFETSAGRNPYGSIELIQALHRKYFPSTVDPGADCHWAQGLACGGSNATTQGGRGGAIRATEPLYGETNQ